MWTLLGHIVLWAVVVVIVFLYALFFWALHEKNEATRIVCNKLLGLPENTPYSWYVKQHRQLRDREES